MWRANNYFDMAARRLSGDRRMRVAAYNNAEGRTFKEIKRLIEFAGELRLADLAGNNGPEVEVP